MEMHELLIELLVDPFLSARSGDHLWAPGIKFRCGTTRGAGTRQAPQGCRYFIEPIRTTQFLGVQNARLLPGSWPQKKCKSIVEMFLFPLGVLRLIGSKRTCVGIYSHSKSGATKNWGDTRPTAHMLAWCWARDYLGRHHYHPEISKFKIYSMPFEDIWRTMVTCFINQLVRWVIWLLFKRFCKQMVGLYQWIHWYGLRSEVRPTGTSIGDQLNVVLWGLLL